MYTSPLMSDAEDLLRPEFKLPHAVGHEMLFHGVDPIDAPNILAAGSTYSYEMQTVGRCIPMQRTCPRPYWRRPRN